MHFCCNGPEAPKALTKKSAMIRHFSNSMKPFFRLTTAGRNRCTNSSWAVARWIRTVPTTDGHKRSRTAIDSSIGDVR